MYNNATVIRLSPSTPVVSSSGVSRVSSVRSATFEEAFGEYSELRGDRKRRRLERLKRRRERRKARLEARRKKREARRLRKLAKLKARAERKKRLMEMREERKRKKRKEPEETRESEREDDRKEEADQPTREESSDSQEGGDSSQSQEGRGGSDEQGMSAQSEAQEGGGGSSDEQGRGGSSEEQGGGGSSDEQGGGGSSDEQSGGGSSDEQGGGGDDSGNYSEEQEMGDYDAEDGGDGYSESFDGIPVDASFSEMDDSGKASKKVQVDPKLQDLVNKIEWNKELVNRLEEKRKKGVASPSEVSKSIIERKKRIGELESQLEMYLGFDSYSMANGMSERQVKNEVARRRMEVNQARRRARAIRLASIRERNRARMTNNKLRAKLARKHGGDVTPVDINLKPELKDKRMVVPAEKTSKATGIIGLDDARDYDARELDIKLSAEGETGDMPMRQPFSMAEGDYYYGVGGDTTKSTTARSINWTGVVLGIGAGALAIWAIRKYKLIK